MHLQIEDYKADLENLTDEKTDISQEVKLFIDNL